MGERGAQPAATSAMLGIFVGSRLSTVAPPPPPPSLQAPPVAMPLEPTRRPWWLTRRVLAAAAGIFLLTGGATYVVARNEVGKVVEALGQTKAVRIAPKVLAPTYKGTPETLLLVGNDQRPPPKSNPFGSVLPHSNEMLLVRIDPSKPTISMMSIPRELQVTFTAPSGQVITNRINSAYTYGGVELMLKTIKELTGLAVNHVFVVTFPKFKRAVNEIGCVYMTVDRRYYHVNEPGGEQYFEINLQPGYQDMCGEQALEFVANRHEDTSLVRDTRDQRFLLEVKAEYGATLFEDREEFERVLGRAVETDLHGEEQVLDLLELLVEAQGKPVRQVPFQVTLLPTLDIASPQQVQESVRSFLNGTAAIQRPRLTVHSTRSHHHVASGLVLSPTLPEELSTALSAAPELPFPLEYPRERDTTGGAQPDALRTYYIRDRKGRLHPIYVIVIDRGGLDEFYDVQGTTWLNPPLLGSPSQTVQVGSRTYNLYYTGEQIRTIGWREHGAAYWIENTLTDSISPREMFAMAQETVPVVSTHAAAHAAPGSGTPRIVELPPRAVAKTSLKSKLEAALGLAGLAAVVLLALRLLWRRRELIALREQIAQAMALEAHQRPLLATAPAAAGVATPIAVPPAARPSAPAPRPVAATPLVAGTAPAAAQGAGTAPAAVPRAPVPPAPAPRAPLPPSIASPAVAPSASSPAAAPPTASPAAPPTASPAAPPTAPPVPAPQTALPASARATPPPAGVPAKAPAPAAAPAAATQPRAATPGAAGVPAAAPGAAVAAATAAGAIGTRAASAPPASPAMPPAAAAPPGASPDTERTIYRAPRVRRGVLVAAVALPLITVLGLLIAHLFGADLSSSTPTTTSSGPVPVAVFNATKTPGEAHRIAAELNADHIHLQQIGNIKVHLGGGVYVLYPPGAEAQARHLARLIPNLAPRVELVKGAVARAAGGHNEIVVIFD